MTQRQFEPPEEPSRGSGTSASDPTLIGGPGSVSGGSAGAAAPATGNDGVSPAYPETPKQRLDRELGELMQGMRVAIPGVQFMFAFLLTVPFAQGFAKVTAFQRDVFLVALVSTMVSSVCFISPAVQHRLLFRAKAKDVLLHRSNRYGIAGAVALAVAMTSAVTLVVDYLFARSTALLIGSLLAAMICWVWLLQPMLTRRRRADGLLP